MKGEEILKSFPELKPFVKEGATDFEKSVAKYYTAAGYRASPHRGRKSLSMGSQEKFH